MKIINRVSDDAEFVAYLQKQDLAVLASIDEDMPDEIVEKIKEYRSTIEDSNKYDFVEFKDEDSVRFIANLHWVLDYTNYIDGPDRYLSQKRESFIREKEEYLEKYNSLSEEDKVEDRYYSVMHNLMDYKIEGLDEVIKIRKGESKVQVPLLPDGEMSAFIGDENEPHIMRPALDHNKILLYRKDGKPLSDDEEISIPFIQMGMSIAMMERQRKNIAGEYEISRYVSDDKKYLVTEFKLVNYLDKETEEKKAEEKGIKKLFKKFFRKGNKD